MVTACRPVIHPSPPTLPPTLDACLDATRQEGIHNADKVRAIGSTHSFTPLIADGLTAASGGGVSAVVSLRKMPRFWQLDSAASTITVDAGTTYGEIAAGLTGTGFALPNTAALPQFSVAGAAATGTHGSGGVGADGRVTRGSLPSAVLSMDIVGPDGERRTVREGDTAFPASVVSLGLLGIVSRVTLRLVPDYDIRQRVYGTWPPTGNSGSSLATTIATLPEALAQTDSFSGFEDWSIDNGGMLIMRDVAPVDLSLPQPAQPQPDWHGMPLTSGVLTDFLADTPWEATSRGRWHDKMHNWVRVRLRGKGIL